MFVWQHDKHLCINIRCITVWCCSPICGCRIWWSVWQPLPSLPLHCLVDTLAATTKANKHCLLLKLAICTKIVYNHFVCNFYCILGQWYLYKSGKLLIWWNINLPMKAEKQYYSKLHTLGWLWKSQYILLYDCCSLRPDSIHQNWSTYMVYSTLEIDWLIVW